jgi:hypothetical protein
MRGEEKTVLFRILFFCSILVTCSCNSDTDRARSLIAHLSELGIVNNEKANLKLLSCTRKWHENSYVFSATVSGEFNQKPGVWREYAPSENDEFYIIRLNRVKSVCDMGQKQIRGCNLIFDKQKVVRGRKGFEWNSDKNKIGQSAVHSIDKECVQ